jgi:uncharacterized LabA/DUF88 family protein
MESEEKCSCYLTRGKVAILIDGGYFLRRINSLCKPTERGNVEYITKMIKILCIKHATRLNQQIYRTFYYDCPPLETGMHNPMNGHFVKFKESEQYKFKMELFAQLRTMRKMALRLGRLYLNEQCKWQISQDKMMALLKKEITVDDLNPDTDIIPNLRQKQVDMKIGVDIASMVLKHQVESIVLVTGDGDFVPASKMARREGVDFILDPMWGNINPDLNEHVDGINTVLFNRKK